MHTVPCPQCGFASPEGFRFCGRCGSPVEAEGSSIGEAHPSQTTDIAERRQLTVMFCDLVGSTALSERLDPEELREVVRAYQATAAEVIERLGGHIAQFLGDGILVYFGYPRAREDDARRAVLAGLGIVSGISACELELFRRAEIRPAVRVGIHTGEVVAGEIGTGSRKEQLALGRTPNLAARMQEIARPNTVAVSDTTHRLTVRYFLFESLGEHALKGISEPVTAHQPIREKHDALGPPIDATAERMPLVNRDDEMRLLEERLAAASSGSAQVVLISAEAGLGKSRLIEALRQKLTSEDITWLMGACLPYAQNVAFTPFSTIISRMFDLGQEDSPAQRAAKAEAVLEGLGLDPESIVPLLAPLLDLAIDPDHPLLRLSAEQRKRRTVEAILRLLATLGRQRPLALIIEDLHWIDPSSLELLGSVVEALRELPALILLSFRRGFVPPWAEDERVVHLRLSRLARRNVEEMVAHVTGDQQLPSEMLQRVVARTDGVPLFVEELTKMLLETGLVRGAAGTDPALQHPADLTIPATLRDSLTARLDLLGSGKEIAQIAAVIGREFSFEVLQAASGRNRASLAAELERLVASELLQRTGKPPDATYTFRHALIQEAALGSLLKSRRREYHRRIAMTYEHEHPQVVAGRPEELGHHWSRALVHDKAAQYLGLAADRAKAAYANQEAIAFYQRALDELRVILRSERTPAPELLGETARLYESHADVLALTGRRGEARSSLRAALAHVPERDPALQARLHRKEGAIWIAEHEDGKALAALATAEHVLGREPAAASHEESHQEQWWREWIQIRMEKLWTHYYKARLAEMNELVEELTPRIDSAATPVQRTRFFTLLVGFHLRRARYRVTDQIRTEARASLQAAEEMGDLKEIASAGFTLGFVLLIGGSLDEAEELLQAAVSDEEQIGETDYIPAARSYLSLVSRQRADLEQTRQRSQTAIEISVRLQQPVYEGIARANLAWVSWRLGEHETARTLIAEAEACWSRSGITFCFCWIARLLTIDLELRAKRPAAALEAAQSLIEEEQQDLGRQLNEVLEQAIEDQAQQREHRVQESLEQVVTLAREARLI